jgi:hypothetical protein
LDQLFRNRRFSRERDSAHDEQAFHFV